MMAPLGRRDGVWHRVRQCGAVRYVAAVPGDPSQRVSVNAAYVEPTYAIHSRGAAYTRAMHTVEEGLSWRQRYVMSGLNDDGLLADSPRC